MNVDFKKRSNSGQFDIDEVINYSHKNCDGFLEFKPMHKLNDKDSYFKSRGISIFLGSSGNDVYFVIIDKPDIASEVSDICNRKKSLKNEESIRLVKGYWSEFNRLGHVAFIASNIYNTYDQKSVFSENDDQEKRYISDIQNYLNSLKGSIIYHPINNKFNFALNEHEKNNYNEFISDKSFIYSPNAFEPSAKDQFVLSFIRQNKINDDIELSNKLSNLSEKDILELCVNSHSASRMLDGLKEISVSSSIILKNERNAMLRMVISRNRTSNEAFV